MSLRKAINAKCRECTYDPLGAGSAAQQIACSTSIDRPLHAAGRITATMPSRLLDAWWLSHDDLCGRARPLIETSSPRFVDGRDRPLTNAKTKTDTALPSRLESGA